MEVSPAADATVKRTAIYCRVSTTGQEDNYSLATQPKSCRHFAEQHGYRVDEKHCFTDVASGFSLERPGLDALRAALSRGEIRAVIVNSYDRWSSRNVDLYRLYNELSNAGASLARLSPKVYFRTTP